MTIKPGAIRFNTDSMKLEIFRGSANYEGTASAVGIGTLAAGQWEEIVATSPDVQTGGTRGMFVGGHPSTDTIDYVNIASTGNAEDFGNLTKARQESGGFANRTRALVAGDSVPASDNTIDFWTISSTGNATDFGDLLAATANAQNIGGFANETRGVFTGGYAVPAGRENKIQYVTIASTGNTAEFGSLTAATSGPGAGIASPTRGFTFGGSAPGNVNTITFVTISTLGNAADFGDMTDTGSARTGASSATRGIAFPGSPATNAIDYFTMATTGNAKDFGDLSSSSRYSASSGSSTTRAVVGGGGYPSTINTIEYIQIATTGDAQDFGDLTAARSLMLTGCFSNGHGGL